jgi:hypothetical protein
MSFELGIFTDQSDSTTIADPVVLAAASAVKLPPNKGRFWNDMGPFTEPTSNRRFEIYSRTDTQRNGTIGAGDWDATATTALPVTSSAGLIKGLILQIAAEVVVVNTIVDATTITVVARGAAGTTGAIHLEDVAYTVIGSAINDVDLKNIDSVSEITQKYENFMQTVAEPIDYTKGGQLDPRKGIAVGTIALLETEAMTRVAKNISVGSVLGLKQDKDAGKGPFMTAGLIQQLSDDSSGRLILEATSVGVLNETKFKAALRTVTNTGTPTVAYMSTANKDIVNEFNGASSSVAINTGRGDTQAGYYIDSYNYEGLIIDIKIDSDMPDDAICIVNINKCKKGPKAGDAIEHHDELPASSREKRASFNGSYGIAIDDVGYEHIIMTGVTQS